MGRRKGLSTSERLLRETFASELLKAIGNNRGAQLRAAESLGVSRQAISLYLKRKATPGGDILRRACGTWQLDMDVRGLSLNASSFGDRKSEATLPEQRSLFEAISGVDDQQMKVAVLKRSPSSLELKVIIDFDPRIRRA